MIYQFQNYKDMTDEELVNASSIVDEHIRQGIELRNNPKYRKKFINQPPPNINPALIELKDNIVEEIRKREKEKENG